MGTRACGLVALLLAALAFATPTHATVFGLKSCGSSPPLCGGVPSAPPTELYSFTEDGSAFTSIGSVTLGTAPIDVDALAISPVHGLLGFRLTATGSTLVRINPTTAAATAIGSEIAGGNFRGAVFDLGDTLRVLDKTTSQVLTIDPLTGAIVGTPVALTLGGSPFALSDVTDIAVRADGTFYLTSHFTTTGTDLYTLDAGTGALTLVFTDGALQDALLPAVSGIAFSGAASNPAHLFAYEVNGFDDIFRYDADGGAGSRTLLYPNIVPSFNAGRGDLAALPLRATDVPEPATLLLLGLGLAGLAARAVSARRV